MWRWILKIKRITQRNHHFEQILSLDTNYAPHAGESLETFRDDIEVCLHNPFAWLFALISDDDTVRGFCLAYVSINTRNCHIQIEKFFCRDSTNVIFFRKVRKILCDKYNISPNDVYMNTRRNPSAWKRFMSSRGLEVETVAYLLRVTDKE